MPSQKSTCTTWSHTGTVQSHCVNKYPTKVVNTSQNYVGVSSNWKLDYYKFKNMSFAQVLKRAISKKQTRKVTTQSKHVFSVVTKDKHDPPGQNIVKNCSSLAEVSKSTHHQKTVKTTSNKVSVVNSLLCQNRFDTLAVDSVVESSADTKNALANSTQVNLEAGSEAKNKSHLKAPMKEIGKKVPKTMTDHQDTDSFTKYDIPITTKSKTQNYKSVLPHCATLRLWDVQNKHKFRFIPLRDLCLPKQLCPRDGTA